MRFFDLTNGKQFPETLHIVKNIPHLVRFYRLHYHYSFRYNIISFWEDAFARTIVSMNPNDRETHCVLEDFTEYVLERVPIYFVNTNQIGQTIDVQETGYSMYETTVPDNHFELPDIEEAFMGRGYRSWDRAFRDHLEREVNPDEDSDYIHPEYPFDQEVCPEFDDADVPMLVCEADGLYCPTGGDPRCKESNPEIFIYMDHFVDSEGNPTRPREYMQYVIAHELAHAMMDERLWEAFLCKPGQTLAKNISHKSIRYALHEEGIATAVGWAMTFFNEDVAKEIMRKPLPYRFGLSPYFFDAKDYPDEIKLVFKRIPEWLSQKINDPTPYL